MTAGNSKAGGNREQEISSISRALKSIAKELDIPVIALSQLSRAVETRGGSKRPLLSDLRESGAIEQDADIVSFIYRPEYYKIHEWDDDQAAPSDGQAELIIAKHRNGSLENIRLRFESSMARFSDIVAGGYRSKGSGSGGDDNSIFESKMNRVEPRENDEYNSF
jgi:replicative DNA helicase